MGDLFSIAAQRMQWKTKDPITSTSGLHHTFNPHLEIVYCIVQGIPGAWRVNTSVSHGVTTSPQTLNTGNAILLIEPLPSFHQH